jgi:hypothetical protein
MMPRGCPVVLAAALLLVPAVTHAASSEKPGGSKHVGWDLQLAPPGERGEPFVLEGRVMGANGSRPLRDVLVYVYHADDRGLYSEGGESHPRLAGMLRTSVLGGYRVRTILPGTAEGVPHLHFELAAPGSEYRALTLILCRAVGPGSDTAFQRLPQMLTLPGSSWAYVYRDIQGVFQCKWDLPFDRAIRLEKRPEAFAHPPR